MTPLSFIRRIRAKRKLEAAQEIIAQTKPELERARKLHRPTRHLERALRMAQCDILRAEIAMGGR